MKKLSFVVKNRRALSPIFATLIILAVVTVLFIPVFIWATGMTSQTQESWQTSGVIATERIVVEEVSLLGIQTPPNCTIWTRNIGKTSVTIDNVIISGGTSTYVYQKIRSDFTTVNPSTGNPLASIVQGDLIEIRIPNLSASGQTFNVVNGTTYTVKVVTSRGVGDSYEIVVYWHT